MPLRFQTFEESQREEHKILTEHAAAWEKANAEYTAVVASLSGDDVGLAKMVASEVALGKADADRLRKQHGASADIFAMQALVSKLRALTEKRDERLFGYGAVAKRSLRFASANPDRFYGPAASSLPPSA